MQIETYIDSCYLCKYDYKGATILRKGDGPPMVVATKCWCACTPAEVVVATGGEEVIDYLLARLSRIREVDRAQGAKRVVWREAARSELAGLRWWQHRQRRSLAKILLDFPG